jgi:intracellular septation protein
MTLSPQTRAVVRMAVDYAALAVFAAVTLITHDMQRATWWLVGLSAVAIGVNYVIDRKIAPLPLIYGSLAMVFGLASLIFHDPRIIKMKTTFIDLGLGAVMLGGLAMGKSPIKLLIGDNLKLSDKGWKALTLRFGLFFVVLAALNEAIWRTQPDSVWVLFRMPGLPILTFLFSFTQVPMMMKDAKAMEAAAAATDSQQ